jgi:hypothetical protein
MKRCYRRGEFLEKCGEDGERLAMGQLNNIGEKNYKRIADMEFSFD